MEDQPRLGEDPPRPLGLGDLHGIGVEGVGVGDHQARLPAQFLRDLGAVDAAGLLHRRGLGRPCLAGGGGGDLPPGVDHHVHGEVEAGALGEGVDHLAGVRAARGRLGAAPGPLGLEAVQLGDAEDPGAAGEQDLAAAAEAGHGVGQDAADADDEAGVHHPAVDDDRHAGGQPPEVAQVRAEGVVAVDGVTAADLGPQLALLLFVRERPVGAGGHQEGDAAVGHPGLGQGPQQVGHDAVGRRRPAEVVDDDQRRPLAAGGLFQRRSGDGLAQGPDQLLLAELGGVRGRQDVDAPGVRHGQLDVGVAVPGAGAQGDPCHRVNGRSQRA